MHNEVRSGCPSVVIKDMKDRNDARVRENIRFTLDELHEVFLPPFHNLSSMRLSHFSSDTEVFVPDGWRNSYGGRLL